MSSVRALVWMVVVATAWLLVPAAGAQNNETEVRGIRTGGWTISPSVEVEAGYESNVRRLNDPDTAEDPDDVVLAASATLAANRQGGKARLETSVAWDLRKYARNAFLDAFADVDAGASLVLNPEGNVDFQINERFTHETRPLESVDVGLLRRTDNTFSLAAGWHPGGPLEATPGLRYTYENFFDDQKLLSERHTVAGSAGARWLFYPRTALALDAEVGHTIYSASIRIPNDPAYPNPGEKVTSDVTFWRLLGGVTGKVTEKMSAQLEVGLADARYVAGESPGVTFAVESVLVWKPTGRASASIGYSRTIVDAYFTNYYVTDRFGARYKHVLRDRFTLAAAGAIELQDYSDPFSRTDTVAWFEPTMKTRVGRWFDLGVRYRYLQRLSKGDVEPLPGADPDTDYITHSVFVGLTATY